MRACTSLKWFVTLFAPAARKKRRQELEDRRQKRKAETAFRDFLFFCLLAPVF
jgi:intergrase/recombinase